MRLAFVSAFALIVVAAFALNPASAQQASWWRVTAREGVVRVREPGQESTDATLNQTLQVGAAVTTGADGSATLQNGAQRIVMTPNSRMTIAPDSTDAMTRILQDLGSLLFQVDRREAQHFRVETPLLAAVVKGTTFTVSTAPHQDTVHVTHGLVEVRANTGDAASNVAPGVTARVARGAPGAIAMSAPGEPSPVVLGVATLPALDYAIASGGVLEGPTGPKDAAAAANHNGGTASGGRGADLEPRSDRGASNVFGQSVAAVRNLFATMVGGRGNAGARAELAGNAGGGNGPPANPGANGNGPPANPGANGNGPPASPGANGNGPPANPGANGNGNTDPTAPPVCRGRSCN